MHYTANTVRTVALRWVVFKRGKGFATMGLGLIYTLHILSQPPSHDTVPLNALTYGSYHSNGVEQSPGEGPGVHGGMFKCPPMVVITVME
jgi:hypothetical protein